jgi:hypothetical protein
LANAGLTEQQSAVFRQSAAVIGCTISIQRKITNEHFIFKLH